MSLFKQKPKPFKTGQLIITDDIVDKMADDASFNTFVYISYLRYMSNDWGDIPNDAKKENRRNIKHGGNLGGKYSDEEHGYSLMIITTESRDRTIISGG